MDAFQTLAADHAGRVVADAQDFLPITWALSRSYHVALMAVGLALLPRWRRRARGGRAVALVLAAAGGGAVLVAYGLIRLSAGAAHLPQTLYPDSLVKRPWDLAPLGLLALLGAVVCPRYERADPGLVSRAVALGTVPLVAAQLYLVFGSSALYDAWFNAAHALKVAAYLVPLGGLLAEHFQARRALQREVLARRVVEEALEDSRSQYQQLVEVAEDIIYQTDAAGHFIYANPVAARVIKYDTEELLGKRYLELIRPDYREQVEAFYLGQAFERRESTYFEFPIVTKDGGEVWIGQNVRLVSDAEKVLGFHAVARDITQRKRMEEERRKLEDELRRLLAEARRRDAETQAELEKARRIQERFFPHAYPRNGGLSFAGHWRPSRRIGGDFFDAGPTAGGRLAMMIADISGHGVPAALLTGIAKALFRSGLESDRSPSSLLRWLNGKFTAYLTPSEFLTMFVAIWHPDTRVLAWSRAGHTPALVLSADAMRVSRLQAGGAPLGVLPHPEFPEMSVTLAPGDRLLMYTDGITEAQNPDQELFGEARLARVFAAAAGVSLHTMTRMILDEVDRFAGAAIHADDQALLAVEVES
jgi:PAS domain S-box-containing protein